MLILTLIMAMVISICSAGEIMKTYENGMLSSVGSRIVCLDQHGNFAEFLLMKSIDYDEKGNPWSTYKILMFNTLKQFPTLTAFEARSDVELDVVFAQSGNRKTTNRAKLLHYENNGKDIISLFDVNSALMEVAINERNVITLLVHDKHVLWNHTYNTHEFIIERKEMQEWIDVVNTKN